jgi:HPt (histidine-containing phosphotransfer) domain-containing protein
VREPVDLSTLLELRGLQMPGGPDGVARIVSRFLSETPERLASLRQAAEAGDRHKLEQGAHALKGIAGTVGANELLDLTVRLEQIGREGRIQDAADLVQQLESALERARPVYDRLLETA